MAEMSLESDPRDSEFSAGTAAPEGTPAANAPAGAIVFAGRFMVQPGAALPHLSTRSANAYLATDNEGKSGDLYALVGDASIPVRFDMILGTRGFNAEQFILPVKWGHLDWPLSGRMESVLILSQPTGEPLMNLAAGEIRPMIGRDIINDVMQPMHALLSALNDRRLVHRNIRPDNLFRASGEGPVMSGEFFSAPAGYNQPACFEPLDRAMCAPLGRGAGDVTDDLYALGVTAMFLALGKNPVADIDEQALLARRMEVGSFAAILGDNRLPTELTPAIRSLMRDNPHDRWTLEDLDNWAHDGLVNPTQPVPHTRVERPFEFAGGRHFTASDLSLSLGQHWEEASGVVKSDAVERWAERSMKDREFAQEIADCRMSGTSGPRMIGDDLLLARILITLNPAAPLRYRKVAVMPDGLGSYMVAAAGDAELARDLKEMLSNQLLEFWVSKQSRVRVWSLAAEADAAKILVWLNQPKPGFAVERALYEMNIGLACQSPRLQGISTTQARDVLVALDATTASNQALIDRHIAAFLGARFSGNVDPDLAVLGGAAGAAEVQLAQMKVLALVQNKHGPAELPNLYRHFLGMLPAFLSRYHNLETRKHLKRAAERMSESANLGELVKILDNSRNLRADQQRFDQARRQHRQYENEIRFTEDSYETIPRRARVQGHRVAAYISALIGTAILAFVVISRMS